MEKVILEQIKRFIEDSHKDETMVTLRKTTYVKGYKAALADIGSLIKMGEELSKGE